MQQQITYKAVKHKGEDRIAIYFKYNETYVKKLKSNKDAKWSSTMQCWHISDTIENSVKCKLPQKQIEYI